MTAGPVRWAGAMGVTLCLAGLIAAAALPGASQAPAGPAPRAAAPEAAPPRQAADGPKRLRIDAEEVVHNDKTGEGEARKVVIADPEGTVVRADLWKWNDKVRVGKATGNLVVTDPDMDATADEAEVYYDRTRKLVVLIGHVVITVKPRESQAPPAGDPQPAPVAVADGKATVTEKAAKEDEEEGGRARLRRYPVVVRCARAEYLYARDRKRGTLSGGIDAVQTLPDNERRLAAPSAEWFGLEDRLVLKGPVRFEDRKGRKAETEQDVEVLTKDGAEGIRMRQSRYWVPVDDEPVPAGKPAPGEAPAPVRNEQPAPPKRNEGTGR